jgi:hypothetical protein
MPTYDMKNEHFGNGSASRILTDSDVEVDVALSVDSMPTLTIAPTTVDSNVALSGAVSSDVKLAITEIAATNSRVELAVTEFPQTTSNVNLAITEIPQVRAHFPAHYTLGISVFGIEVLTFSVCGESQAITEPYRRRDPERCP